MEEIEDWEMVVHNSLETSLVDSSFREIDGGDESPQSLIKLDYFDLGSNSGNSDLPSLNCEVKSSSDLLMDYNTDGVNLGKVVDFEGKQELGFKENEVESKGSVDSEEIRDFGGNDEKGCDDSLEKDVGFEGTSEIEGFDVENGDNSGETLLEARSDDVSEMENSGGDLVFANVAQTGEDDGIGERSESSAGDEVVEGGIDNELGSAEEGKRGIVWWKLPFELLKFCAFRVSPVLSISVAAALLGFVILRRRLSRMKPKSRSIPIKLTVEDKKVSQFTTRAGRLNDAFSVVRHVPIMRPLLPAAGVTPWPAVNMR